MKILLTLFVLFFSFSISAKEVEIISNEELIEVFTLKEEFCYNTKITKPINEYNEHEEWKGYYFLKTEKSCDQFLDFQKKIYETLPQNSHLPFSGKAVRFDEKSLNIFEFIYLDGKISETTEKNNEDIIINKWTYTDDKIVAENFNNNGKLSKVTISNEKINPLERYTEYRINEEIYFDESGKKILLHISQNRENNTINLKENNLVEQGYSYNNENYSYYVLKTIDNYILLQLDNNNISALIYYYDQPYSKDYDWVDATEISNFVNGEKKFETRVDFEDTTSKDDFIITLFDKGKAVIEYDIMSSLLTFESTIKDNKDHGVRIQWSSISNSNEITNFKCTDNGYDNEIDLEKNLILCDSNYLYDLRISEREKYFSKNRFPKQNILDNLILLEAFIKLYPR